jgi:hypothetical protein
LLAWYLTAVRDRIKLRLFALRIKSFDQKSALAEKIATLPGEGFSPIVGLVSSIVHGFERPVVHKRGLGFGLIQGHIQDSKRRVELRKQCMEI